MKIKITPENKDKIEKVLREVNGKAVEHTITRYGELQHIADRAIDKIYNVLRNKATCKGARLHYTSGLAVANSYRYSRKATRVTIVFNGKLEAFLYSACSVGIYTEAGKKYYTYTEEQKERIKELAVKNASQY